MITEDKPEIYPIYPHGNLAPGKEYWPSKTVIDSIYTWGDRKKINPENVMAALRWDSMMSCYCFGWLGMFVGIELDGHIHT